LKDFETIKLHGVQVPIFSRRGLEKQTFDNFLSSRKKEETRQYSLDILDYLSKKFEEDLPNHPNEGNLGLISRGYGTHIGWISLTTLKNDLVLSNDEKFSFYKKNQQSNVLPRGKEREGLNKAMLEKTGKKIPNESTFYKILEDLQKNKLIERKEATEREKKYGKKPTSYRVPGIYLNETIDIFASKEKLIEYKNGLEDKHFKQGIYLEAAKLLLSEHCGGIDVEGAVREMANKLISGIG
jgi:hypothetical protein